MMKTIIEINSYKTWGVLCLQICFSISGLLAQSGKVGINTFNPAAMLHVADSSVLFSGNVPLPNQPSPPPVSGPGVRMMWYPQKAAFRAGYVDGTQWNKDSIGVYSFAVGYSNQAKGDHSIAMGEGSSAIGNKSIVIGSGGAAAYGSQSLALGYATAYGTVSTAIGIGSYAFGVNAMSIGKLTQAYSMESTAMGYQSKTYGDAAISMGYETIANAYACTVVGVNNDTTLSSRTGWNLNDPVFIVGNGYQSFQRSNAMTILKNGNTGIGTKTPGYRLHVVSTDPGDGGYTEGVFIENTNATFGEAALSFKNKSIPSTKQWILGLNQAPYLSFTYGASFTSPLTRMVIDTLGRMGLNTISPQATVHVVKNNPSGGPFNSNSLAIYESDQSSDIQLSHKNDKETGILSGNEVTAIRSAIIFPADSAVLIRTGGNFTRVSIENNGNVGIGTLNPAAKLDVNGTVKLGTNGTPITELIKATVNKDLPSVAANSTYVETYTVTNAQVNSAVNVSQDAAFNDGFIIASSRVTAANTVEVRFVNTAASSYNPPAMDFHFIVIR